MLIQTTVPNLVLRRGRAPAGRGRGGVGACCTTGEGLAGYRTVIAIRQGGRAASTARGPGDGDEGALLRS